MIATAEQASSAVVFIETRSTREATLAKVGLSRDRVRALLAPSRPLCADEVRKACARSWGKGRFGRKGAPRSLVEAMYADYQRLHSCAKVAKLYGRTRQAVWEILHNHERELDDRTLTFKPVLEYNGRRYTLTGRAKRHRYYRDTRTKKHLHRQMWEDAHGPVPAGMEIVFVDGDQRNVTLANLACMPRTAWSRSPKPSLA